MHNLQHRLLFLLLFATTIHAQAPSTFREGVIAFEKKEWKEAERLMRATLAVNPNETAGTVSIAGSWFETYVPHYFLARALARQGKCEEALKEFAETERQGVTPTIPDFARHLQTRGGCKPQAKPAKLKEVLLETTVPFGEEEAVVAPPVVPAIDHTATRLRLRAAVNSYLHGRYDEAVRVLTQATFTDPAALGEAALLRAAARHALYRSGGANDTALRAQIDADLRAYRSLRPNAKPDPRMFPPSFIALAERRRPAG